MLKKSDLMRKRNFRKSTLIKINNFLDFCNVKIHLLPKNQRKLMRMYMVYANRLLFNGIIAQAQINNLLTYINFKMNNRKKCLFTGNYCLSDFPDKINPQICKEEGPCMLLT